MPRLVAGRLGDSAELQLPVPPPAPVSPMGRDRLTPEYRSPLDRMLRTPYSGILHRWPDLAEDPLEAQPLIRDEVTDAIFRQWLRPGWLVFPVRKLTRRERVWLWIGRRQAYLRHLGLALIGRCDRD